MDRRDTMWLLVFVVLGVGGLAVFLNFYNEAIPSASLDFKLSRDEVHQKAQGYLENLGYDLADFQSAQIFSSSQMQQIFLEQTLGLEETSRLAREWLSVWSWSVRWFKPLQKEELRVGLDPGGRIVGFWHRILESDEGASLTQDDALEIASRFLGRTQGYDLEAYELIDRSSTERKARIDHQFAYRKKDFTVGDDGHYRLDVVVHGDRVGRFSEYLKVPESFSRSYREVRSRANLLTQVFLPFWLALGVAMLVILVKNYRRKRLRWQAGLVVGTLVAVAWLAANVNALPLALYNFETTISYGAFLVTLLFSAVLIAAVYGGAVCLAGTAGGVLERDVLSEGRASPVGRLSLRGMFSAGFLRSTVVGYGAAEPCWVTSPYFTCLAGGIRCLGAGGRQRVQQCIQHGDSLDLPVAGGIVSRGGRGVFLPSAGDSPADQMVETALAGGVAAGGGVGVSAFQLSARAHLRTRNRDYRHRDRLRNPVSPFRNLGAGHRPLCHQCLYRSVTDGEVFESLLPGIRGTRYRNPPGAGDSRGIRGADRAVPSRGS